MSRKTYAPVKHTTYLECVDEIPPAYCRLIAREKAKGGWLRILTIKEIAQGAGLTWQRTAAIARRKSFATVTVEDADKFRKGCGITLENERVHKQFIKRHLSRENSFEKYFRHAKAEWPASWRAKFVRRIVQRL